MHQLTDLAGTTSFRKFDREFAGTNRLRTEGTDHLVAAARAAGARRLVAQSFAGWPFARVGGPVKTEDDPLDPDPPAELRRTLDAIRHLEAAVLGAEGLEGVVLRYGGFYGPGTSAGTAGSWPTTSAGAASRWSAPAPACGRSSTSTTPPRPPWPRSSGAPRHLPDRRRRPGPGVGLAAGPGRRRRARPPRRVPAWLARLLAGEHAVVLMTEARGASNAKAKRDLAWRPAHPSWRGASAPAWAQRRRRHLRSGVTSRSRAGSTGSGRGRTGDPQGRAAQGGSHQFQRPRRATRAGTRRARRMVASIRMPAPGRWP